MKEPFYDVAAFIEVLVIRTGIGATLPGRDHRHRTRRDDLFSKGIRVVGFIAYYTLIAMPLDQRRRLRYIVAVSRRQNQPQGHPGIAERKIQFRGNPPQLCPRYAASCPPFSRGTGCTRVCPHYRGIHEKRRDFTRIVKMFMKCLKDTHIAPSPESTIEGVPIPVDFRQSPPRRTFFVIQTTAERKRLHVSGSPI